MTTSPEVGCFALCDQTPATILTSSNDWLGVIRAANDLAADMNRVTRRHPQVFHRLQASGKNAVIIGTIGKSEFIDQLIRDKKIDVSEIANQWESFFLQVVHDPFPGIDRALVICGSDKRGTIYGIYDLSEQIGVSPWYWWADVPAKQHENLFVKAGKHVQGPPVVKYRGIFINDEEPCFGPWARAKFGGINSKMYSHMFELLLRLRANYLWPAMWGKAFNEDDPLNPKVADEYGIVMGTSHHEPMIRAQQEWTKSHNNYGNGLWDYSKNEEGLKKFWTEGIERNKNYESLVTVGMRGDGDVAMPDAGGLETNKKLLEKIITDQRQILAEHLNADVTKLPQLWALFTEVQQYYDAGLKLPDDVTLLFCDDNVGEPALPVFDSLNPQRSYVDVFARGSKPIEFKANADQPWIILKEDKSPGAGADRRIWVDIDWSKAPVGQSQGAITISGSSNSVTVRLAASKATAEQAREAQGCFGGLAGPISVLAADAVANIPVGGVRWEKLPDYGRVSTAMEVFPVTADNIQPPNPAPRLEYPVYFARAGTYDVDLTTSPTMDVIPTRGLGLALSIDDQPPQVVNAFSPANYKSEDFLGRNYNENTRNNTRVLHFKQTVSAPGKHTLKILMVDPTVVAMKVVIHDAPVPASYFGPSEVSIH